MIFNKKAPKVSEEANVDILPLARWFAEEKLTYTRVFGVMHLPMFYLTMFHINYLQKK